MAPADHKKAYFTVAKIEEKRGFQVKYGKLQTRQIQPDGGPCHKHVSQAPGRDKNAHLSSSREP